MKRETLERRQVLVCLLAVACGLGAGALLQERARALEPLVWPLLALLLYATFAQVPLLRLREAFADARFLAAALAGNFLLVPGVVWLLVQLLPGDPAIRLGAALVLLVPCTDWFISFTHLGKGDAARAAAFAPVSLLAQMLLLPLYLWILLGADAAAVLVRPETAFAFFGLVLLPLGGALLTERWAAGRRRGRRAAEALAWWPVPLLALVVFTVGATQAQLVAASLGALGRLLLVFAAYLVVAGLLAKLLAGLFALPPPAGRTLAFSLGSRNSFVVLPLALALPQPLEFAVVVVVFQSLVELAGMALYLWWVPGRLFPSRSRSRSRSG